MLLTYHRVKHREEQPDANWEYYYSPWHKGGKYVLRVSKGHRRGGLYASCRWEVAGLPEEERSSYSGYGAMSLVAALLRIGNDAEGRLRICRVISDIFEMRLPWLEDEHLNGISECVDPRNDVEVITLDTFSIEALDSLGCFAERLYKETPAGGRVPLTKGGEPVFRFSFGPKFGKQKQTESNFDPERLHRDFHLYEVKEYTGRKFWKDKLEVSLRRKFHPLFPIFATVQEVKSGKSVAKWGEVYQPEWHGEDGRGTENRRFVFYGEGIDTFEHGTPFLGDGVCTLMFGGMDAKQAANKMDTGEMLVTARMVESEDERGKKIFEEVDLKPEEVRVNNLIICQDALSAINAYYSLNSLSTTYTYNPRLKDLFFHVVWKLNPKRWDDYDFSLLGSTAINQYLVYNADKESKLNAFKVCKRNPNIRMAAFPDRLPDLFSVFRGGVLSRSVDVRAYFSSYEMTEDESISYSEDKNLLFLSFFTRALPITPFIKKVTKENKSGEPRFEYRVDSACLWQLMATEGYCRSVQPDSTDIIGKYMHIDGCFVRELDVRSVIVAATNSLRNYAQKWAGPGTEEYQKMVQAINGCKDLTELRATNLPVVDLNYKNGYGEKLDHFFYRNGALRITPDEIKFIPYSQISFNVDRAEILPFDFRMPCVKGEEPFRIYENPEYVERVKALDEHRHDTENYTQLQIQQEERELEQWSQTNRWKFKFREKKVKDWWQPLQVIRCFANEEYQEEIALQRMGKEFSEQQEKALYARMANILYSLGRPLFRYKGGGTSYMPYITENRNSENEKAEGGSGKSAFVNVFMGCSGKIYRVNSKNIRPDSDITLTLDKFIPRMYRVIHWEDWPNGLKIDPLYNYVTSGFVYRHRHNDSMYVPLSESPGHVISSNFQQTYDDPSSSGRVVPTGFSHCFNRGNVRKNEPDRKISYVMPGFRDEAEDIEIGLRSQMAYINALAVQFCMNTTTRVLPPMGDLNERSQKKAMGDTFVTWANDFFSNSYVFYCPIDLKTIFSEYIDLCDTSDDKKNKFSASTFRRKIYEYCADKGYVCNPDVCLDSVTEKRNGYMRVKAWCRTIYFADETVWGPGRRKEVRELRQSQQCLFFVPSLEESGKLTTDRVHDLCREYYQMPDPSPCIDPETGKSYELTDEERTDWNIYMLKKQGNYAKANRLQSDRDAAAGGNAAADAKKGEAEVKEELPF